MTDKGICRSFAYFILVLQCAILLVNMAECRRHDRRKRQDAGARKQYAMYVWTNGFDHTISGCSESKFLEWDKNGGCFSHTWDTEAKRAWLWSTCNLTGREIGAIFISDVHHNLKAAYETGDCSSADITRVKNMLSEGHTQVPGLKIYGLYAVSDMAVSEQYLVKYIVYYNDHCAGSQQEKFDGVAVNNEAYAGIKCGDMSARLQYLDNLQQIVVEANKQQTGTLLTHYSMSWHWGRCDSVHDNMTWNGVTQDANHHMIDIFNSTDVQVGYIIFPQISHRMKAAGYDYAVCQNKEIYTTVYTNKNDLCQLSFFPKTCHIKDSHTEAAMFARFDEFPEHHITHAHPCIHYFRGVYSSGGHSDWPLHDGGASVIVG